MKLWSSQFPAEPPSGLELFWQDTPAFFRIFIIIFAVVAVGILSAILYSLFKGIKQWSANNASELVTAPCTVVAKRFKVYGGSGDTSASTNYYVTYELQNGARIELEVPDQSYGLMVEGDRGELTYQGTRFKGFKRAGDRASGNAEH
ncbi:DUF2500 domain-containing protein [Paenibacillus sp. 7124]|uniref:DUF2500 domain-containing protein n=1 Tax=Paenibacillus apii TaxID=1850370 RepID=A0A6M1PSS2_9BACL|nr:DUF2500 domain-containing protein [Paenibacillus apii]NGM83291.1 DUF2500 domain-containing protein [Paenibacillus apii]NJJ38940.1 DUF2500 domain-containing protein [Paenibacillus apii]